jgi:hypothetical protein
MRKTAWRLRNDLIERMAHWGDRFLYKPHLNWLADRRWTQPYAKLLEGDRRQEEGLSELRILDRRYTLAQFARSVRGLKGSTAECGVLRGVGSGIICQTLDGTYGPDDYHFGFDSFEGLPAPITADRTSSGEHWWSKGALKSSQEEAEQRLADFEYCRIVKGWIPDCFERASDARFRLAHIDVDLYEPTRDSLEFFYPRLVPYGIILLDDHGFMSCPGARQAAEEFFHDKPEVIIELATGQAVVIRQN